MSNHRLANCFLNLGYPEPVYERFKEEIAQQNNRMVLTTSFAGSLIMLGLSVSSVLVPAISRVLPLYLATAVLFCAIYMVTKFLKPKNNSVIILCNYIFLLAAFFFAIGLDIIQKNEVATTVCVLLVALPLLIVDIPIREILFFLCVSICFMLESVFVKQSPKASVDVVDAVSFLIIGSFLGYRHNQMVLRNIIDHRKLEWQRDTDELTGLYTKNAFVRLTKSFIDNHLGTGGLVVMDMDNFKYINDTYGHQTGDEILAKVGGMLSLQFRKSDYVCRFGGDEFVAFIPNLSSKRQLRLKAEGILEAMSRLRIDADETYRGHLCMGIASFPQDGDNMESLFKNADDAMYKVKRRGKNGYAFYNGNYKKKILVVDDIEMNRAILKKVLGEEYDILEAENGRQAIEVLNANRDLCMVITDIMMPVMDGIELIKFIRSNETYKDMALIAETQSGDIKQENEILTLGVDDFVFKAASPGVIQMRVHNVMKAKNL